LASLGYLPIHQLLAASSIIGAQFTRADWLRADLATKRREQTKTEIIAYLKNSFVYMHRAAAVIDDAKRPISTPGISPWPEGTATRLGVAIEDCVHSWDHYGQLLEYLRMNGIVPPASRNIAVTSQVALAQPTVTVSQALDFWISNTEKEVVWAADAMPEAKYSFAPTAGEFTASRHSLRKSSTWPQITTGWPRACSNRPHP
jgi:hypothetical protein